MLCSSSARMLPAFSRLSTSARIADSLVVACNSGRIASLTTKSVIFISCSFVFVFNQYFKESQRGGAWGSEGLDRRLRIQPRSRSAIVGQSPACGRRRRFEVRAAGTRGGDRASARSRRLVSLFLWPHAISGGAVRVIPIPADAVLPPRQRSFTAPRRWSWILALYFLSCCSILLKDRSNVEGTSSPSSVATKLCLCSASNRISTRIRPLIRSGSKITVTPIAVTRSK